MISDKELKQEKDYLKAVLYILEKKIENCKTKHIEINEDIKNDLRYTWDSDNTADENYWAINMMTLERKTIMSDDNIDKLRSYTRMIKSAYFARIDFETEGEQIPVYLGIASLEDGTDFYIYDWRSPIASMFYDYELGEASYETPDHNVIKGKITLKRQYKIQGSEIKEIFDTSLQIIDDILKQMLMNKTTDKMKNIVASIQKEQNKIIRKEDVDILAVDGPAGSGKTSVAMHKIAYLLYSKRGQISRNNVLIISPNDVFNNYISNVLPEVGEENVYETTFMDFIKGHVDYKVKGSLNDLYETVYSEDQSKKEKSLEYNSIMLKYGPTYIHLIEKFLALKRNEILGISDIVIDDKVVIDKAFLEKAASEMESSGISLYSQGKKLIEKVKLNLSVKLGSKHPGISKAVKALENNLLKLRVKNIFLDLYSDEKRYIECIENIYNEVGTEQKNRLTIKQLHDIFVYTEALLQKNIIPFEDVSGYLYIKDRILGSTSQNKIKNVIIDEAQDYTIMQYKILSHLFKHANITILGDLNQSIMPFAVQKNYEGILNVLRQNRVGATYETNYLAKTYRSTYEINMFSKHILGDTNMYNQVDRHGDEVSIIKDVDGTSKTKVFTDALDLKKYYNSIAIITKTQADANHLKAMLEGNKKSSNFKVVTARDKVFSTDKIMIIPSYLAKGLEFDAVLVYDASVKNYPAAHRNLLYVVCTRALHKLNVYYKGELTTLIK